MDKDNIIALGKNIAILSKTLREQGACNEDVAAAITAYMQTTFAMMITADWEDIK